MNESCLPGLIALGIVSIGVASWSLTATLVLNHKIKENAQLREQRDELVQSWDLILNARREGEER